MQQRALVISKDLVNELKSLAVLESKDDASFEGARQRYEKTGQKLVSSSANLAIALYNFVLRYADQPTLVDDKLNELEIQFKNTSSVYVKIARLAFDDVRDENGDVSRTRVSRYAQIIESAHTEGMSAATFQKVVERGVTQALRRFKRPMQSTNKDALEQGLEIVRELAGKKTFSIDGFPLPESAVEGDDVELLARVEGGKLVVYGAVPSNFSNVKNVLTKLGTKEPISGNQAAEILPELLRALKLVTSTNDRECIASYEVRGEHLYFYVFGPKADAVLAAPAKFNLFGATSISLKTEDWRRVIETLIPIRQYINSVSVEQSQMLVQFNEDEVPNVDKWYEKSGKAKMIGKGVHSSLDMLLPLQTPADNYLTEIDWRDAAEFSETELEALQTFKPSKKCVSFPLVKGALNPSSTDKAIRAPRFLTVFAATA
jgi:hypothetical protein